MIMEARQARLWRVRAVYWSQQLFQFGPYTSLYVGVRAIDYTSTVDY